jgi:TatD DNase family protein
MEKGTSLIDVHAHLEELKDLSLSLKEAKETGVRGIIAVGMDIESNKKTLKIAQGNRGYVYPAIGYHPWEIKEEEVGDNYALC